MRSACKDGHGTVDGPFDELVRLDVGGDGGQLLDPGMVGREIGISVQNGRLKGQVDVQQFVEEEVDVGQLNPRGSLIRWIGTSERDQFLTCSPAMNLLAPRKAEISSNFVLVFWTNSGFLLLNVSIS